MSRHMETLENVNLQNIIKISIFFTSRHLSSSKKYNWSSNMLKNVYLQKVLKKNQNSYFLRVEQSIKVVPRILLNIVSWDILKMFTYKNYLNIKINSIFILQVDQYI